MFHGISSRSVFERLISSRIVCCSNLEPTILKASTFLRPKDTSIGLAYTRKRAAKSKTLSTSSTTICCIPVRSLGLHPSVSPSSWKDGRQKPFLWWPILQPHRRYRVHRWKATHTHTHTPTLTSSPPCTKKIGISAVQGGGGGARIIHQIQLLAHTSFNSTVGREEGCGLCLVAASFRSPGLQVCQCKV